MIPAVFVAVMMVEAIARAALMTAEVASGEINLSALTKVLEQTPSAVAILVTVSLFIKHLSSESKATREFFQAIHAEHIDQRVLTRQAMEKMTLTTEKNIDATDKNTATLATLGHTVELALQHNQQQHHHRT